jgi:endonuclease G
MSKHLLSGLVGAGITAVAAKLWYGKPSSTTTDSQPATGSYNAPLPVPASSPSSKLPLQAPVKPSDLFKYGFPGPVHDLQTRQEFVSVYDRQKRNPYYVVEHITKESLKSRNGDVDRKRSVFKEDENIPAKFRSRLRDYFRSGYDRGHQAPAANAKFNQDAMDETFYLTNISPQVGEGFNRDYWAHLEFFARECTSKYDSVRIVTGPLYLPKKFPDGKFRVSYEVIGNPPNIAVPTHFFKLIIGEKGGDNKDLSVAAFVLPNDIISNTTPLRSFEVPLEALEVSSGLNFLQNVPEHKKKSLCQEVRCDITVRDFSKANQKLLPAPK